MPYAKEYAGQTILVPIRELEGDALRDAMEYKPKPPNLKVLFGFVIGSALLANIAALF